MTGSAASASTPPRTAVVATQALGQVPDDPAERAQWERKAGQLGGYREITGWDRPGEAIGPEPSRGNPETWAEWHAAFGVMARVEGIDVRHLTEGQLFARRRAYEAETSWAPKHVAEELRAARKQEQFSKVEATRHTYEAASAARQNSQSRPCSMRMPPGLGQRWASGPPWSARNSRRPTTPAANGRP